MALRRLAQQNYAAASTSSTPRSNKTFEIDPDSPLMQKSRPSTPSTPKSRVSIGVYRSPASTPSLSATVPFDWEAARSHAHPPFSTPAQKKIRKSMGVGSSDGARPSKRVVRKKGIVQKIADIPSLIMFHISMFPQNIPMPTPQTSSRIVAGTMHAIMFLLRVVNARPAAKFDAIYIEDDSDSWWDWSTLLKFLAIVTAFANVAYLFTRTRKYHFHSRQDPISSPNAKFVSKDWDQVKTPPRALWKRILSFTWWGFVSFWRFLLNMQPPLPTMKNASPATRVQELEVWSPGELNLRIFSLWSPVHAFLWLATTSTNWIPMLISMGLLTITLNVLIFTYETLIRDKEVIAAEVMHEYNQGFVYPRIMPVRHDVGVMTHESEIVSVWD
ncbi:hypothetical protein FA15DRAFT_630701 [Coprinopsis marcescibilis]|uniref:Nuclear rim protein 1 n=1 Tax=Coprinopsis marcescibilis TaxID=230819 RepID=A0A5C3LDF5_COPMA|nr:hypothetical protein FA15DRAFT_630701 [Coprinopsis marcescibilis]